jgi:hypothetical protein
MHAASKVIVVHNASIIQALPALRLQPKNKLDGDVCGPEVGGGGGGMSNGDPGKVTILSTNIWSASVLRLGAPNQKSASNFLASRKGQVIHGQQPNL